MIKNVYRSSRKVSVIFVRFLRNLIFFRQIFEKYSNISFNENASSGSRDVPCGERDRWTDMTKLIVALRNFAKAPNNVHRWLQSDSRLTNRTCFSSPRNYKISKCVQVSDVLRVLGVSDGDILNVADHFSIVVYLVCWRQLRTVCQRMFRNCWR
jgi:hypothetical protein